MVYGKKEAKMTQGFAILCMLVLHLFCRKGNDVLGTPLIWLNDDTPLVYVFGFFSEICVMIYAMCTGYAQYVLNEKKQLIYKMNLKRILQLLLNYWVVLVIFSVIAVIRGSECGLSVTPINFLQNFFLLGSYNGAWWYLHTYIFMMLIPPIIMLSIPRKVNPYVGISICVAFRMLWVLAGKFGWLSGLSFMTSHPVFAISYVSTEASNLISVLPAFFIGAFLCKGKIIDKASIWFDKHISASFRRWVILLGFTLIITVDYLVHKAIFSVTVAVIVFVWFNIWKKTKSVETVLLFLGKHSTNIWLCHMFFYVNVLPGLVSIVRYPVLILLFMILLCTVTSYAVNGILWVIRFPLIKRNKKM